MAAWIGAGVAAAGVIGDAMSASSAQSINQKTMNFDAQMQANQQAFAQSMFNQQQAASASAVQTRMADIKKAGLNPALAVGGGGAPAAQVTQGQGISSPTAQLSNPGAAYANLGSQISSAAQTGINSAQTQSNMKLNSAQAMKAVADAVYTAGPQTQLGQAMTRDYIQSGRLHGAQADATPGLMTAQTNQANAMAGQAQADSTYKDALSRMVPQQIAESKSRQDLIQGQLAQMGHLNNLQDAQAFAARVASTVQGLTADQIRLMMPMVLEQARNNTRLQGQQIDISEPIAAFARTPAGMENPSLQQFIQILQTARSFVPFTSR